MNWAYKVDMKTGRPQVDKRYSPGTTGPDVNVKGICPAALGSKDEQPSAYDPTTGYMLVPTNHVCMTYEPFQVEYTAGQPYVGATLTMFPGPSENGDMGNFIAWDPAHARSRGPTRSGSRSGRACSRPREASHSTARWMAS